MWKNFILFKFFWILLFSIARIENFVIKMIFYFVLFFVFETPSRLGIASDPGYNISRRDSYSYNEDCKKAK